MITTDLTTLKINKLTKAQYEAALAAGNINENELYMTPEEDSSALPSVTPDDAGKVLTVNESGEWEVDIVQSDWNINDESSSEYVKNRPFYTGDPVETYIVQNASLTQSGSNNTIKAYTFSPSIELIVDTKYTVYFNSTSYECVCSSLDNNTFVLGNLSIAGASNDTGEPFLILSDNSTQTEMYTTYISDIPSVSISALLSEIVKIDKKYIPELDNYLSKNNPIGTGSFSLNRKADTTVGDYSFAEGDNTTSSGSASHAEGSNTEASGWSSHAEGDNTTASSNEQHVQGRFNVDDSSNIYADIIGNGTSDTKKSNASTVDWSGNAWFAGDVYVGSTSGTNKDSGSKKLATEDYVSSLKPTITTTTLSASSWDSTAKTYSFESTYPNASYDIEVALDSTATSEQVDAFNGAQIVGSAISNVIKAYGDVPTVDIPVILKVVTK